MHSTVMQSIIGRHGYPVVSDTEWQTFAARHEHVMLLLAGDAARLAESDDLAVILPELVKVFGEVLVPAIAARDSERLFQRRYRFSAFPALVIVRHGKYLGAISRVRDWQDYLMEIPLILSRQPSEPPPFKLPGAQPAANADDAERADPLHLHH